jgi:hypothetical protein
MLICLPASFPRHDGEKFDFIDNFANRQRRKIGTSAAASKPLPVLQGERKPAGR